jgi:hypothetical protein
MKKNALKILLMLLSVGIYAQSGSSSGASVTYDFETAINGKWHYNPDANVYYIVGLCYCASPIDKTYEQMGIFVPGAFMDASANADGTYTCTINSKATVNGYTASTAPIVVPINTPGYAAQAAPSGYSSSVATLTSAGFIYLWPGVLGKTDGAPLGVTDLKAAVRYFRYLQAEQHAVPGNTDCIFSFGHSSGGAMSVIFGASGNSKLYDDYLLAIRAKSGYKDNICGSMSWCPRTSIDMGDAAYEWNMGLTRSQLSTVDANISKGLAAQFAIYVNEIGFKDPSTGQVLTLSPTSNGYYQSGLYYEYVMKVINDAISRYNRYNNESVPLYSITETSALYSFVSKYKKAANGLGAYDNYVAKGDAGNELFGISGKKGHFDQYLAEIVNIYAPSYYADFTSDLASNNLDAMGKTVQERLMMYSPLFYLIDNNTYYSGGGNGSSVVAPYWRIRTGINQDHAPLNTEINLALALQNYDGVKSVDFETIWERDETQAEDSGNANTNFIAWVNKCVAATATNINNTTNTDNTIKAYSTGKVIYLSGKLAGCNASLISINGITVRNYKLTNNGLSTFDESELVDGFYILQVSKGNIIYTSKLILNK